MKVDPVPVPFLVMLDEFVALAAQRKKTSTENVERSSDSGKLPIDVFRIRHSRLEYNLVFDLRPGMLQDTSDLNLELQTGERPVFRLPEILLPNFRD